MKTTGVKSLDEFRNNPAAQEKYHSKVTQQYIADLPDLEEALGQSTDPQILMAINHFLGKAGAITYLKALRDTGSYDEAQKVWEAKTLNDMRKSNPNAQLPKNQPVAKYLHDFSINLNK
jgi:hypothetical protein